MTSKLEEVKVVLEADDMGLTEVSDAVVERGYNRGKGTFYDILVPSGC